MSGYLIGCISDTHGVMRPEALAALEGVNEILHAGDVGSQEVLDQLQRIAPVTAVRGNVDVEPWCRSLPTHAIVEAAGLRIALQHQREDAPVLPAQRGLRIVMFGHTHQPLQSEADGVLYLNPGSAGPRRFRLPVSLAKLSVNGNQVRAEFITLNPAD